MNFTCSRCRTPLAIPLVVAAKGGAAYCSACGTSHVFAAPPRSLTQPTKKKSTDPSVFRTVKLAAGAIFILYMSCTVRSACNQLRCGQSDASARSRAATPSPTPEPTVDVQQEPESATQAAQRTALLQAGAESAAHEISVALGEGQDLAAGGRWHEAEAILKTIDTRLQEYRTLETMPPAIVPIQKLFEERQQQVIHILIPLDLSASMEKWFNEGEDHVSGASTQNYEAWLAAQKSWEKALIAAMTLEKMDDIQRPYVHAQLKQIRRKIDTRLKKAARVLVPYHKRQALMELCGPAPEGCGAGWDGACPGSQSAFKRIAHDPGSVDVENCSQPVFSDKHCWVSTCEVKAKNAFGAKIRSVHRFSFSVLGVEVLD